MIALTPCFSLYFSFTVKTVFLNKMERIHTSRSYQSIIQRLQELDYVGGSSHRADIGCPGG